MDRTVLPKLESWITGIYEIYYWSNGFARASVYLTGTSKQCMWQMA